MRLTRFIIFAITILTTLGSVSHANKMLLSDEKYEIVITDVVLPFLDALKNGDVGLIKSYIAGDIYKNKRVLLEKNKEYSAFLRNYYQDVEFYIEKALESGDYIEVYVGIEFSNGDEGIATLYLAQDINKIEGAPGGATWKIIEFRYK